MATGLRKSNPSKKKWKNYIDELANLIFFWGFSILFFTIFRLSFVLIFSSELNWNKISCDLINVLITGFRFDTMVTSYFILVPFLSNLILYNSKKKYVVKKLRGIFQQLFIVLSPLICIITLNYFKEYNNQFNHFVFLALYDDLDAVIKTIISDFNPLINLFCLLLIYYLSNKIFNYFEKGRKISSYLIKIKSLKGRGVLIVLTLILFTFSIRGSTNKRPIMRKLAYVTDNSFLNKTIINPYKSLLYAIYDWKIVNTENKENPFGDTKLFWKENTVCENIMKTAEGEKVKKPKQIFLVVMESYDFWPLQETYLPFKLSKNLLEISNKGISFNRFLPASESTKNSLNSIVTGIPFSGLNQNSYSKYCSSIFTQIEKLGYTTNFFYGGLLSWANLGEFMLNHGVDNQYSAVNAKTKSNNTIWGVDDEYLFELVTEKLDSSDYSFNIILTTSYHPPYSVDVISKGFKKNYIDSLPKEALKYYTGSMSFDELSHLWYSDKCIGEFVNKAEKKFPNSIFLFTGDHYGRRFVNENPNLFETSTVPFILYGNGIADSTSNNPGSHIDIFPSLIELIAPKGFKYFSFGESLFKTKNIGFGIQRIITQKNIESYFNEQPIISFDIDQLNDTTLHFSKNYIKYNRLQSLSWHYTVKGDTISEKKVN